MFDLHFKIEHSILFEQTFRLSAKTIPARVIGRYCDDARIFAWDIYNEPGQCGLNSETLPLLIESFRWAREENPSQPLTSGVFSATQGVDGTVSDDEAWTVPPNQFLLGHYDIISFHCCVTRGIKNGASRRKVA